MEAAILLAICLDQPITARGFIHLVQVMTSSSVLAAKCRDTLLLVVRTTLENILKEFTYFKFPNAKEDRQRAILWLKYIGTGHKIDSYNFKDKVVCSKHFESEHFFERDLKSELLGIQSKKNLKKTAVPTLFNFPHRKQFQYNSSSLREDRLNKRKTRQVSFLSSSMFAAR